MESQKIKIELAGKVTREKTYRVGESMTIDASELDFFKKNKLVKKVIEEPKIVYVEKTPKKEPPKIDHVWSEKEERDELYRKAVEWGLEVDEKIYKKDLVPLLEEKFPQK